MISSIWLVNIGFLIYQLKQFKLSSSRPYVRKRALLLLYKIFMKYPEALRSTFPRLRERLEDQDPG
jgi:hypothetical protein